MPDRADLLILMLMMMNPVVQAADNTQSELPSIELIEFLGEWETDAGEWIGPDELADRVYSGLGLPDEMERDDE